VNAHERYPDRYYGHIYINEPLFKGIAEVARIEGVNKRKAAQLIIELGFSSYMGEKVIAHIEKQRETRENNLPEPKPSLGHASKIITNSDSHSKIT